MPTTSRGLAVSPGILGAIPKLEAQTTEKPFLRAGQRLLAEHVTTLVHGADETARVMGAANALFGSGDLREIDAATLEAALSEAPNVEVPQAAELPSYADLFAATGLVASKSAARRAIAEGGAYVNNQRVDDPEGRPSAGDLLPGGWLLLRRGKRNLAGVKVT